MVLKGHYRFLENEDFQEWCDVSGEYPVSQTLKNILNSDKDSCEKDLLEDFHWDGFLRSISSLIVEPCYNSVKGWPHYWYL